VRLRVHNDTNSDLREIHLADRDAAAKIVAFIQALRDDPDLCDRLLDDGYGKDRKAEIFVRRWESIQRGRNGLPVWRLRSYDLEDEGYNYRFVYLYYWKDQTSYLVAVRPKSTFDYESTDDPIRKRIITTAAKDFPGA
jgi:hypothetical protein